MHKMQCNLIHNKLKHFSLVGETGPEDTELHFTKPIPGTLKVDFIFVVVCSHEIYIHYMHGVISSHMMYN